MIRTLCAACLFSAVSLVVLLGGATGQQPGEKKQPAKGKYDPPESKKPDEATMKLIVEKTEQLRKAIAELKAKKIPDHFLIEIEIHLKAAENIVRFEEWYANDSGKWVLTTLDQGLARAKEVEPKKAPWQHEVGKWVVRAYRSEIDKSIQPYAVLLPLDYGKDPLKLWRLDVVLHGRDSSLTEAKFIATHKGNAPKDLGYVQLEVYGRGNNAYRWAGETDVFEVMDSFRRRGCVGDPLINDEYVDDDRTVLRGFSMGGAGTWHIGLHHPHRFKVMGPGAGFTTTHGYIAGLPEKLPDYQEKCLHIYDAVDYAENAFNIPIVAYSGENDEQKAAADNIEKLLKGFKEPVQFTHLIAPGLKHEQPKIWQEKAELEYRKHAENPKTLHPDRIRYVTYTSRYSRCDWVQLDVLEKSYEKSVIDVVRVKNTFDVKVTNVRSFYLHLGSLHIDPEEGPVSVQINGQKVPVPKRETVSMVAFHQDAGKWSIRKNRSDKPQKDFQFTGPIDDAFRSGFWVVNPTLQGWSPAADKHSAAAVAQFATVWDKYFRGKLPMGQDIPPRNLNVALFGDPASNPTISQLLPQLPITWTQEKLVVNGMEYDPKTHLPVLIYPITNFGSRVYVVINSGHTFKEADLKGTNALLYPRLGDWAVIKPTPTAKDPAAYEVVAAGLFDENWQFPKK